MKTKKKAVLRGPTKAQLIKIQKRAVPWHVEEIQKGFETVRKLLRTIDAVSFKVNCALEDLETRWLIIGDTIGRRNGKVGKGGKR